MIEQIDLLEQFAPEIEEANSVSEVFGDSSYVIRVETTDALRRSSDLELVGAWGFEVFILLMSLLYLAWGSRRLSIKMGSFFRGESHMLDGSGGAHVSDSINANNGIIGGGGSSAQIVSVAVAGSLVLGAIILLLSKGAEVAMNRGDMLIFEREFYAMAIMIDEMGLGLWMVAIAGLFCASMLWFVLIMWSADLLSRSSWLYAATITIRSNTMMLCAVVALPMLLLAALDPSSVWAIYATLVAIALSMLYYVCRTFLLFAQQNVSLLHWFLYLCAVELVPLTLIWKLLISR